VQELFLVKKCMKLVLLGFYDNKLVLNHTFIFLIVIIISFMKSVGLGLVTIRLVSSAKRINLDLILLSLWFVIFGRSLMFSRKAMAQI
jgi:hypothetical protein